MERVILHCDLNSFYASVECFYHPELRPFPVAVAGEPEKRHGIILAKNGVAKKYGIKTGEAIWQAKQKCPHLICVPPDHALYMKHSRLAREIYGRYSDLVEGFGPDEAWVDISGKVSSMAEGKEAADEIRSRVREELGITASVGVSFNKVFAKLGSDYRKPNATTVISRENFRSIVWPLPVQEMIYVGPASARKLASRGIYTLGELAQSDARMLQLLMGKHGVMLWNWANGREFSPVRQYQQDPTIKSIGNSTTAPRDITDDEALRTTLWLLCESVASRLRRHGFRCSTVQVYLRDTELFSYERQMQLDFPAAESESLYRAAYVLAKKHDLRRRPLRSLGVRACNLQPDCFTQLCFYPEQQRSRKQEELERAVDGLRERFGAKVVRRGLMFADCEMSAVDPQRDHTVHPESFFRK